MLKKMMNKLFGLKTKETQSKNDEPLLPHLNINRSTGDCGISIHTALKKIDVCKDVEAIRSITGEKKASIKVIPN